MILNLGILDLEKDKWKLLTNVIKEKLCNQNQNRLFQIDPEIEKLAEHYASLILEKWLQQASENIENSEEKDEDESQAPYESVDVHSVSTSNARTQGAEHVAIKQMDELSEYTDTNLFNSRKTIVIDAGIATDDNLKIIKSKNYNYVAVSRKRSYGDNFWDNTEERKINLSRAKSF